MTDIANLKSQGGIDVTCLQVGTKLYIETTMAIYCLTVMDPHGLVTVESSHGPFKAGKPELAVLIRSDWDDKGQVTIPHWIGRAMRMVFKPHYWPLHITGSVETAMIEGADGSWKYELWESPNYDLTPAKL